MAPINSSSLRLSRYLSRLAGRPIAPAVAAVLAGLDAVELNSPKVARAIIAELKDQRTHLKLIASENYCSLATQLAMGNLLTDKCARVSRGIASTRVATTWTRSRPKPRSSPANSSMPITPTCSRTRGQTPISSHLPRF